MAGFKELNEDQTALVRLCGMDPSSFAVILENERCLWLLHLKSRNEVAIHKYGRIQNGSK